MYQTGREAPVCIPLANVVGIHFSGADPASGRSWDAWLKKVAEAEAKGEIAELYPEE
jgi:hypothetical protein